MSNDDELCREFNRVNRNYVINVVLIGLVAVVCLISLALGWQ